MRTIGRKWKREVKRLMLEGFKKHLEGAEVLRSYVIEKLDNEAFETWESAYSEIEMIVWDTYSEVHEEYRELVPMSFLR